MRTRPHPDSAAAISSRLMKFVWEHRLPRGHISLIGGYPSRGKSLITYEIAADLDVNVVFASAEEIKESTWRPRLEAAGADLGNMFMSNGITLSSNIGDLANLRAIIREYSAKLVVADPITNHLKASIRNDQSVREALEPVREVLEEEECSLLAISHLLKSASPKAHPLHSVGGAAGGLSGLSKAVYIWGPNPFGGPKDRVLAEAEKFNFGERPATLGFTIATRGVRMKDPDTGRRVTDRVPYLVPTGEAEVTAREVLMFEKGSDLAAAKNGKISKASSAEMVLVQAMKDGPITAREAHGIADSLGVSHSLLRAVADSIGVKREKRMWIPSNS